MDLNTVTSALSGIKIATEIAKTIKDIDTSYESAELKLKIVELMDSLMDAKIAVVGVREELSEKETEIEDLKRKLELKGRVIYEAPYYWLLSTDEKRDGPYCQSCYDSDQKLIRLQEGRKGA